SEPHKSLTRGESASKSCSFQRIYTLIGFAECKSCPGAKSDGSSLGILFAASKFNPLLSDAYRLVIFNIYSFYMPTFLQAIDLKEYLILTKSCKFNNLKKCSHVIVDLGLSISY